MVGAPARNRRRFRSVEGEPGIESTHRTYDPINVLKPVAINVWIVDGPIIRVELLGFAMPFPTRMTIVRLDCGDLFIHSPTALTPELKANVEALGTPRYLIGPSWLHYWWIPDWKRALPDVRIFVADGVRERARKHIDFDTEPLKADQGYPWDDAIYTLPAKVSVPKVLRVP